MMIDWLPPDDDKVNSRMACFVCRQAGVLRAAVIRVFSGASYVGDGWPACAAHADTAIDRAFEALDDARQWNAKAGHDSSDWRVKAYAVERDEEGYPRMRRILWTARLRPGAVQASLES